MSSRTHPATPERVPRIADLIDLELALEEDREQPLEVLLARDARIRSEIDAGDLDDRGLLLAWLDRVRVSPESPGESVEALLRLVLASLVVGGLLSGALAVAGWLWTGPGAPVNVVQLWPALVGLQLVLAVSWVLLRPLSGWIARSLGGGLSTWLPTALGSLVARFARPGLSDAWHRLRSLDRLYGGLRFWRITQLTQSFAVAFNLGALAALLFIPTVDDPAFGWRSRLMDATELQAVTIAIASPWSAVWPDALPSRAEIDATEGSSLTGSGERTTPGRSDVWAAWWPFLVASFVAYGLIPRLVLQVTAAVRTRSLLRRIAFDHEGCVRVRERLRRPIVDGRGQGDEVAGQAPAGDGEGAARLELPGRVSVVRWAGVPLEPAALSDRIARTHGVVVERVETVGGLDVGADETALAALREASAVLAVVEAWEAPSRDYVDVLRRLRGAVGERVPVLVLPCQVGEDGRPTRVEPAQLALWRRQLVALADPWLRVDPFPQDSA